MKTSNKLIVGLFIIGFLTLIGANVALKIEYNKIDFNDPFYGLSSMSLEPFRVLKLEGNNMGLLSVQTGEKYEIRLSEKEKSQFTFRKQADTLLVSYKPESLPWQIRANMYSDAIPAAVILTPSLQMLTTNRASCNLNHLNAENLAIFQESSGVLLTNTAIGNLTVTNAQGSEFHSKSSNRIGTALIISRDSSSFLAEHDVFGSLTLQTDSLARVKVPGSVLKKLKP